MNERIVARIGGWAAIGGGLVGAAIGIMLLVVPPAAPADLFNYPFEPGSFVLNQWVLFVQHLVLALAMWCYWRAGLAGRSRLAAAGAATAVTAMAGLALWEIVAIAGNGLPYPSDELAWIDVGYTAFSLGSAVGVILLGIATVRARVLTGASRWTALIIGIYVFVPNLPLLFAGFLAGRISLTVWFLLFVWLGWAMLRWAAAPVRSSADVTRGRVDAPPPRA